MKNVGFLTLLAVLFIGLKLGNVIAWAWWAVLLPLWGPLGLAVLIVLVTLLVAFIVAKIQKKTFGEKLGQYLEIFQD